MADVKSTYLPGDVVTAVLSARRVAEEARATRMRLNRRNREIALGLQDWSHKIKGQSTETLPKLAVALEQFAAFVKRGLTSFGDWFDMELPPNSPLTAEQARTILMNFLDQAVDIMPGFENKRSFASFITDAVKQGLLESLMVVKVHGRTDANGIWRLKLDLIRTEDYYPDPSGRGLFELHSTHVDLHHVQRMAEVGLYDRTVVSELTGSYSRNAQRQARTETERGQDRVDATWRNEVRIDEYWGTLLGSNGEVIAENIVCAIANDRYLIRPPEPNPFLHGESPLVVSPILRVNHSVWHRAAYDDAAALNAVCNELFNLLVDGGIAAVWGVKQLQPGLLEDPSQVQEGIPQGMTLLVRDDVQPGVPIMQRVDTGEFPAEGINLYTMLEREFQAAAFTNDLKLGNLPPKQVKATEIVEAQQGQAITLDSIIGDIENEFIVPLLRKSWLTILQNITDTSAARIVDAAGLAPALRLASIPASERVKFFTERGRFRVHGMSGLLSRGRDFQKLLGFLQMVTGNPLLMQLFLQRFSMDKLLDHLLKLANIRTQNFELSPQELAQQQMMMPSGPQPGIMPPGPPGGIMPPGPSAGVMSPGGPADTLRALIASLGAGERQEPMQ